MTPQSAETLALEALGYIATDEDTLSEFISLTGADLTNVRAAAADPLFLAAVLDFLLSNEQHLIRFCEGTGVRPELPMRARTLLPGGDTWIDP